MRVENAGFYLHTSNRTEELLVQLAAVLETRPQQNLLAPELFLIQSQGMERVITRHLARQFSAFCNFQFFLPLRFLLHVGELLGVGVTPDGYDRDLLAWRLNALLAECDGEEFAPLQRFLQSGDGARRRFQLARRLANNFDQYQLMRSDMVLGWEETKSSTGSEAERWQMALWNRLGSQQRSGTHRATLFARLLERLESSDPQPGLPQRVSIFGVHTLPPIFLQCLSALAKRMDVHLYLLSPCRHYWGDQRGEKQALRNAIKNGTEFVEGEGGHPLLADLGRQGRELQNLMLEEVDFSLEIPSWHDPAPEGHTPTLLQQLQHDLLEGRTAKVQLQADDSLRIQATHSRWRELQVLHDHLRRLLEEDPDLTLRDLIVMAPDIQNYAALIPAAFGDMPFSIADRSLRLRNPAIAAFSHFLGLFTGGGRFGRSEVLELLQYEPVATRFDLSEVEVEEVCRQAEEAGIRWGLSAEQRAGQSGGQGSAFGEASFRAGLERLLMGVMIDCDEAVDGIYPAPAFAGRSAAPLGGLCQLLAVVEEAAEQFRTPCSLGGWSQRLLSCMEALLDEESDPRGLSELRALLTDLPASEPFCGEQQVSFEVVAEWFTGCSTETRSSVGFLGGRLTFCSMLPMRSIPFQAVCLLGLDDGVFPKTERADTFDLIAADSRPGDRSPRNDDRYQFLEAILAARRVLYLSYVGLSEKSGEPLPPSVVVSELLELLRRSYGVRGLVVEHPLYAFSERCFNGQEAGLFSCNREAYQVAMARREAKKKQQLAANTGRYPLLEGVGALSQSGPWGWWRGEVMEERASVSVQDLLSFFRNPQAFFVKNVLGIALDTGEAQQADRELFAADGLQLWEVRHRLFHSLMAQGEEAELLKQLQAEGGWGLGTPGEQSFARCRDALSSLVVRAQELNLGEACADLPVELVPSEATAGLAVGGLLPNCYADGSLLLRFGRLRGRELLACAIHDRIRQLTAGGESWLLTDDAAVHFSGTCGEPGLADLLFWFEEGCRRPLTALVEPAFAWAGEVATAKQPDPQKKAMGSLKRLIQSGYEPELSLLLGDADPGGLLDELFVRFAEEIMLPLYKEGREMG